MADFWFRITQVGHAFSGTNLSHFFFAPSVEWVLAYLHHLPEENIPDLGKTSAGGVHQRLQNGVDVGLDVGPQDLLCFWQH